jgi:hypothetical protein
MSWDVEPAKLAFILSQPRSGSTVLSAMLDRRKGVVCMPESSFPQVLGAITPRERGDKRWLAGLYLGSTFPPLPRPPTPLTLDEAEGCMDGTTAEILEKLGRALAIKLERDPQLVRHVIWKTTRTPGMLSGPLSTGGRFVVLRRHLHNIYDSQFRVDFGRANRNPYRFGVFAQSYENVFAGLPGGRTFELDYEAIPDHFSDLLGFLAIEDVGSWEGNQCAIDFVARSGHWLREATQAFRNDDPAKRGRLAPGQRREVDRAMAVTRPLRPFLRPVRSYYDRLSLDHIRSVAKMHLEGTLPPIAE